VFVGNRAVRVQVLKRFNKRTYQVRFPTRKFGVRNRVGTTPVESVFFEPPHLLGV
jgi:hypothetical protein